jgi:hypothetical protein
MKLHISMTLSMVRLQAFEDPTLEDTKEYSANTCEQVVCPFSAGSSLDSTSDFEALGP